MPHLIINKILTSFEGIAELGLLFQHYDWKDIRADLKAYFIIFADAYKGREARRLKTDFDGKEFMGRTLMFGHHYIGGKKTYVWQAEEYK